MALSDHNFIECNLDLPRPCLTINEVYYRKLKKKKMVLTGLPKDRLAYSTTRDNYTKLLHDTKRYYANLIDEAAGDTKKLFNIMNSQCKDDKRGVSLPPHDSPRKLANEFGNCFNPCLKSLTLTLS